MNERECGYRHDFHEPDRCQKCGGFLACKPTREESEPEEVKWPSGRHEIYHWTLYERTCPRCGHKNAWQQGERVEVLAEGAREAVPS